MNSAKRVSRILILAVVIAAALVASSCEGGVGVGVSTGYPRGTEAEPAARRSLSAAHLFDRRDSGFGIRGSGFGSIQCGRRPGHSRRTSRAGLSSRKATNFVWRR